MRPTRLPALARAWSPLEHGGIVRKGRRKLARPFDRRRSMHVVLRSTRARGSWSFLHRRHKGYIHALLVDLCEEYGVKLYKYENVGNHLHLLVRFPTRPQMQAFLRVFAQRVMFLVTGARKGQPQGRFFDAIAYSRVVDCGREFKVMKAYIWKNTLEALGFSRSQVAFYRALNRRVDLSG